MQCDIHQEIVDLTTESLRKLKRLRKHRGWLQRRKHLHEKLISKVLFKLHVSGNWMFTFKWWEDLRSRCCCIVYKSCLSLLWLHGLYPTKLLCSWDFLGKNTEMSCHLLLQDIFLTQGLNLGLLHCRLIIY